MDTSTGPATEKDTWSYLNKNTHLVSHTNRQHQWPCIRLFPHSGFRLHCECSLRVSWPSLFSCVAWIYPPNQKKETSHMPISICRSVNDRFNPVKSLTTVSSLCTHLCPPGIKGFFLTGDAVFDHLLSDSNQPLLHHFQLSSHVLRQRHWLLCLKQEEIKITFSAP